MSALKRDGELDVSYSNVAPFVTTAAPGTDITSAVFNSQYGKMSGTSMAAPHVAAAFALLRQQNPRMTVKELAQLLKSASVPVSDPRTGTTIGRMDLANLAAPEPAAIAMRSARSPAGTRARESAATPSSTVVTVSEQQQMTAGDSVHSENHEAGG